MVIAFLFIALLSPIMETYPPSHTCGGSKNGQFCEEWLIHDTNHELFDQTLIQQEISKSIPAQFTV